jgi:hypothetical protein
MLDKIGVWKDRGHYRGVTLHGGAHCVDQAGALDPEGTGGRAAAAACGRVTAACGRITAACGKVTAACGRVTAACGKVTSACGRITVACARVTVANDGGDCDQSACCEPTRHCSTRSGAAGRASGFASASAGAP